MPTKNSDRLTYYRLFIVVVAIALLALTGYLLYNTDLGRQVLAVTQNREMAKFNCLVLLNLFSRFWLN